MFAEPGINLQNNHDIYSNFGQGIWANWVGGLTAFYFNPHMFHFLNTNILKQCPHTLCEIYSYPVGKETPELQEQRHPV